MKTLCFVDFLLHFFGFSPAIIENRVTTVQCLSGSGSLRIGAEFLAKHCHQVEHFLFFFSLFIYHRFIIRQQLICFLCCSAAHCVLIPANIWKPSKSFSSSWAFLEDVPLLWSCDTWAGLSRLAFFAAYTLDTAMCVKFVPYSTFFVLIFTYLWSFLQ